MIAICVNVLALHIHQTNLSSRSFFLRLSFFCSTFFFVALSTIATLSNFLNRSYYAYFTFRCQAWIHEYFFFFGRILTTLPQSLKICDTFLCIGPNGNKGKSDDDESTCHFLMWTIAHFKLCYGLGFLSSNYTLIYFI